MRDLAPSQGWNPLSAQFSITSITFPSGECSTLDDSELMQHFRCIAQYFENKYYLVIQIVFYTFIDRFRYIFK